MPFRAAAQMGELNFEIGEKLDFVFTGTFLDVDGATFDQTIPTAYSIYKITPGASEIISPPLDATGNVQTWAEIDPVGTAGASWPVGNEPIFTTTGINGVAFRVYTPTPGAGTYYTFAEGGDFAPGDHGVIVLHYAYAANQTEQSVVMMSFKVSQVQSRIDYIKDTDITDADALLKKDSLAGRLLTCERNQTEVLMPRLRRALGLLGEHQLVDGFLYDDDGNITECRLRLFESAAALTDNATIWNDRVNDSESTADLALVDGEIGRYVISASNLLPRNLRTTYQQKISIAGGGTDATPEDEQFGDLGSAENNGAGTISAAANNGSVM